MDITESVTGFELVSLVIAFPTLTSLSPSPCLCLNLFVGGIRTPRW